MRCYNNTRTWVSGATVTISKDAYSVERRALTGSEGLVRIVEVGLKRELCIHER